ncbi:hypothetical protein [Streptomyces ehimensis]|uniref:Uncharacterized protein n=1 Tax=Streptomyces ehimensis TaxID=68195 RepID=A0ABV9BEQ4_9ACTN
MLDSMFHSREDNVMSRRPYQADGVGLPDDFASILRDLYKRQDPGLPAVTLAARNAGWTLDVLGSAMGVTRVRAGQIAAKAADGSNADPGVEIPVPPAREKPKRRPRAVGLTEEESEGLRALRQAMFDADLDTFPTARDALVAEVAAHSARGVRVDSLGEALGLRSGAIRSYLADFRSKQAAEKYAKRRR